MTRLFLRLLLLATFGPALSVAATAEASSESVLKLSETKDESESRSKVVAFGHNLSPTTHQLAKGDATAGFYVAAVGITDDFMIGTSPWLFSFYNMYSLVAQGRSELDSQNTIGLRASYFQTFAETLFNYQPYVMEAATLTPVYTYKVSPSLQLHMNYSLSYFFDETRPYSLRREPGKEDAFQQSVSILIETRTTESWGLNAEIGVLGLNYLYPQLITGVSSNYRKGRWYVQAGFSATGTPRAYFSPDREDLPIVDLENKFMRERMKLDFSIHPEFQLQYYF